jgi:spore coat polysaccharide biosynthesis predicted glycosyltransferase SpsG
MIQCYSEARFHSHLSIYPAAHLDKKFLNDLRWVGSDARLISGIDYCLLNEKISNFKPRKRINAPPQVMSVIAGGADPTSSLLTIYNWLKDFNGLEVKVYCQYGLGAGYINRIRGLNFEGRIEFCEFSLDLCAKSDLVICAFGVTVYELTYLNIPMLTYGHTQKHADASQRYSERFGCTFHLGMLDDVTKEHFLLNLDALFNDSIRLKNMHAKAKNLVDGAGVKRVSNLIAGLAYEL